jgi:hypothetical protein
MITKNQITMRYTNPSSYSDMNSRSQKIDLAQFRPGLTKPDQDGKENAANKKPPPTE